MKITFVAPHVKIAGGIRAFLTYAHLLAQRGHVVEVIVPVENPIKRFLGNLLRRKPIWFPDFYATIRWISSYDSRNIPNGDILVATAWQTVASVLACGPEKGKKFYLIQHYESLYHGDSEKADATYRMPLKKITISTWLRDLIKEKFNSESEIIVTPVDFKLFHPIEGKRDPGKINILMLDHDAKWKGTEIGSETFRVLKKKYPNIKLNLFGVRKRTSGIDCDNYFFNPKQNELAGIYSSNDIYLCPSEYEGLGMPSMEAMACGCALVTFDNGGSRDYAIDGQTAFVAEHNDHEDFKNKLELAITNSELRQVTAQKGQIFIQENFSWERATEKMEQLFKNA